MSITFPGWQRQTIEALSAALTPTPRESICDWANKHHQLPSAAANPGAYDVSRTPYLREPMELLSPRVLLPRITIRKASQVGGTEMGLIWIAHTVAHGITNMTACWATKGAAQRTSVTRIDQVLRRLKVPLIVDTQMLKVAPGSILKLAGAKSANEFVGDISRFVLADETARWPKNLDGEGDPLELVARAMITFGDSGKMLEISTPTLENECNISSSYELSDQSEYEIPCPRCGAHWVWEWKHLHWDDNDEWLECPECGHHIQETSKPRLLAAGRWVARFPERTSWHRGFQVGGLMSPLGWRSWRKCISLFQRGQEDPQVQKVWQNQVLGLPWAPPPAVALETTVVESRESTMVEGIAPADVCVITAGVDVQFPQAGHYLAVEIVGWGPSMKSWSIRYMEVYGDNSTPEGDGWKALETVLETPIQTEDGRTLPIRLACIDCGGVRMPTVMRFCADDPDRRVAIKGYAGWSRHNLTWKYLHQRQGGMGAGGPRYAAVPVDQLKQSVYEWLGVTEGYGYCTFPGGRPTSYYKQLTSEEVVVGVSHSGKPTRNWRKKRGHNRNEALDCRVYALAAARLLGLEALSKDEWAAAREGEAELVASAMG